MQRKTITYLHLASDADLPDLGARPPFLAVVLAEEEVAEMWLWDAARWLVASGARYVQAWGKDAGAWTEAVDDAALEAVDYDDAPDDRQVLTAAHDPADEEFDEVFWFTKHRAAHPFLSLDAVLIVHIAPAPRKEAIEAAYADA
ncbi:hypothetical protein [Massilia sp. Root335]|uniref:DUF7684 family protein n=1 Tax=Massilia sp. Root335 TaxID=1736517 RepID=UPI0006F21934|nr:hypothetical protein [Massilia sp. Root335]KQV51761.1 hypothetical protein ASC93_07460 [Massilia sp. Root335]